MFVLDSLWPGLILWLALYVSDNLFTMACARLYQAGVREKIVFEGSYELTPYFQKDVDALRVLSPRFLLALLWQALLLAAVWRLTRAVGPWNEPYLFLLGAMILVQATIHVRHLRNIYLFRAALRPDGVRGRIEYPRSLMLRLSAVEVLAFAGVFLAIFLVTGSWFVLGGAAGCLSLALKNLRLERRYTSEVTRAAQKRVDPDVA